MPEDPSSSSSSQKTHVHISTTRLGLKGKFLRLSVQNVKQINKLDTQLESLPCFLVAFDPTNWPINNLKRQQVSVLHLHIEICFLAALSQPFKV